ncbi:unnamed protein product [Pleuronectes platessa]|uniref:Uncharacterized protein n=1 Tax=Pleuronectes platessa TaxID=8262 RepID=A0A9N7YNA1_PLEPL|nr:unnamed protein product [Pleuronectes platessa]
MHSVGSVSLGSTGSASVSPGRGRSALARELTLAGEPGRLDPWSRAAAPKTRTTRCASGTKS